MDDHVRAAGAELRELSRSDLGAQIDKLVDILAIEHLGPILDRVDRLGITQRDSDYELCDRTDRMSLDPIVDSCGRFSASPM